MAQKNRKPKAPDPGAGPPKRPAPKGAAGAGPRVGPGRTAVAVLGSVVALGGSGSALAHARTHPPPDRQRRPTPRVDTLPAGERALLARVFGALSDRAPAIAKPFLERGVADGTITQAQEDRFLARLDSVKAAEAGSGPTAGAGHPAAPAVAPPSAAAQALFQQALAAIRAELPVIALPMVGAAVADGSITEAQAARLSGRLHQGPRLGFGLVMRNARAVGATRLP